MVHAYNPSTQRQRWEDFKFKASLNCKKRLCLKKKPQQKGEENEDKDEGNNGGGGGRNSNSPFSWLWLTYPQDTNLWTT
jgi:hypothetical protein